MADITGTDSGEELIGTDEDDTINGLGGDDQIDGGAGNDVLNGGLGFDILLGGTGNDTITDDDGYDIIDGGDGDDTINVFIQNDPETSEPHGSVNAGAGNDQLFLRLEEGSYGLDYEIDMGDGNDRVTIEQMPFDRLQMTLGAGSDTIVFDENMTLWASHSYVIVDDFQAGDGGDVIEVETFVRAWVEKYFFASRVDGDLFGQGYLELRQVGNNVELWFHPEGGVPGLFSAPLARFLDTQVTDFTAYNFGGQDPDAPPNRSFYVDSDYVIAEGETISVVDAPYSTGTHSGVRFDSGDHVLINDGTIISSNTYTGSVNITGIHQAIFADTTREGLIVNSATGRIEVNAPNSDSQFSEAFGINTHNSVINQGAIDVILPAGSAYGLFTDRSEYFITLDNTGTIDVTAQYAVGVFLFNAGPTVTNAGTIFVDGYDFAAGVYARHAESDQLFNFGKITAVSQDGLSVGYYVDQTGALPSGLMITLVNQGNITGDYAVYGNVVNAGLESGFAILNDGVMNGYMLLNGGSDVVLNQGAMNGVLELGLGNDVYMGHIGSRTREVFGGDGSDTLVGGAGGEVFYGDGGDDRIAGSGGDDIIDGGQGNDALDGGWGIDTVSYLSASRGTVIDLNAGTAIAGPEYDRLRGFEDVIGSSLSDTIYGSWQSNWLFGARGDDVIDARSGNDLLHGGKGTDFLTGGWGADRFVFTAGDGIDTITDLGRGADTIEIYGYAFAASITQAGANVVIDLGDGDKVIVLNSTVAKVNAALTFSANPLDLDFEDVFPSNIQAASDFVLEEGGALRLTDPFMGGLADAAGHIGAAVILTSQPDGEDPAFFNAGTVSLTWNSSAPVAAVNFSLTYGNREHDAVNAGTGTVSVTTRYADAAGFFGMQNVFNAGTISLTSDSGNLSGVSDTLGTVVNSGLISVSTGGTGSGIGALPTTTISFEAAYNSGDILVDVGLFGTGLDIRAFEHPASDTSTIVVNSGVISVTDDTAELNSAGLRFDTTGKLAIWNSGTITADYAIARNELIFGPPPSERRSVEIYNSGTLDGIVQLARDSEEYFLDFTFINTGIITGPVTFSIGDDFFDSRQGEAPGLVIAGAGDDVLLTGIGNQFLNGGLGDDILSGGWGRDTLYGGQGADIFRYEANFGTDRIADFNGADGDRVHVRGYTAWTSMTQVGDDVVVVFDGVHQLIFENRTLADIDPSYFVFGAEAIATSVIPDAPDAPIAPAFPEAPGIPDGPGFVQINTNSDDLIAGRDGFDDVLLGRAGNDLFLGSTGDGRGDVSDTMVGGRGDDIYIVNEFDDLVVEGYNEGIDTVRSQVSYALTENVENLELRAGATWGRGNRLDNSITSTNNNSELFGEGGDDTLTGGFGSDQLHGGDGDDTVFAGGANDLVYGNLGNDTLDGQGGSDLIYGQGGDDTIYGGGGSDALYGDQDPDPRYFGNDYIDGGAGDDAISGEQGDDILLGGDGNDILDGGSGLDVMTGGAGADEFWVNMAYEAGLAFDEVDVITDFNRGEGDQIRLFFTDFEAGQDIFYSFIGSGDFTGNAGEVRFEQISDYTMVFVDNDGDGEADGAFRLDGLIDLQASDFIL